MEPACIRHTELPHTSRLFSDFLYHYHRVEPFYTTPPSTGYPEERRSVLMEALREQNADSPSLDTLARPGALAVVTGQQVGLFSGPAYTIYKALTAAKLAAQMTQRGMTAVPVFWLASEDHDFAEVNHAWVFDGANTPVELRVSAREPDSRPAGEVTVEKWPIAELRQALSELPYGDEVSALIEETYAPAASMGEGFRRLLERLLRPYGFLFVDPMRPRIRALAAPMMRKALTIGGDLNNLLLQRNRELEAAGYHTQVHVDARTSLFFLIEKGHRLPLREVRYSPDELCERAEELSPNALLRPVVQDYMLPTAAYIGGPAELSYFAQSQVLYRALLGHMPRLVSRSGFTLFDARASKLMDRYGLQLRDFFHGEESLRERIAATLIPSDLDAQFEHVHRTVSQSLNRLQQSVNGFDPTVDASLAKSRSKMLYQLSKSRAKVARETLRRDERASAEVRYLSGGIFPQKHLQERFYSILPFLARHGFELIEHIYDNVRLDCPDHILLPV
jgi:bacillithiol biosynthesis cysteine-adding enzyme BshC